MRILKVGTRFKEEPAIKGPSMALRVFRRLAGWCAVVAAVGAVMGATMIASGGLAGCASAALSDASLRAEWAKGTAPLADQVVGQVFLDYVVTDPVATDAGKRFVEAVHAGDDGTALALWPGIRERVTAELRGDPIFAGDAAGASVLAIELRNVAALDALVESRAPPVR